ncbi:MAG: hypothetical protein WAX69_00930 [Victivallales bacterium]
MIGYIQKDDFNLWIGRINSWIDDKSATSDDNNLWSVGDKIEDISINGKTSKAISENKRKTDERQSCIRLYHLWVDLT